MRSRKIKKALSLIEVVLSLGLVAMLLTSLVFLTSYMWRSQGKIHSLRASVIAKEVLWTRLEDALSPLLLISPLIQKNESKEGRKVPISFFCDGREIQFSYRPLVSEKNELNAICQARLYLEAGELIFETGPSTLICEESEISSLREKHVWRQGVDSLRVRLLHIPSLYDLSEHASEMTQEEPLAGWNESWSKEWDFLPHAIVVETMQENHSESWPIWLRAPIIHYVVREDLGGYVSLKQNERSLP